MSRLEIRDLEILRTLARMHFVTSGVLNTTFFPSESVGFRRLRALAKREFIRRHTRGAAPRSGYCAWRLSPRGIGKVRQEFPREPVPENFDDRLCEHSLADLEHREALSRVYLALVGGDRGLRGEGEQSWRAVQLWLAAVRARAEQIVWHSTGNTVLRYRYLGSDHQIVPDATIEAPRASIRLFLDVDRSMRPFSRIERNVERYRDYLRGVYRRSYATNARRRGIDERTIMRQTGHRTRAAFDRYNIVDDSDQRAAVTKYEAAITVGHVLDTPPPERDLQKHEGPQFPEGLHVVTR